MFFLYIFQTSLNFEEIKCMYAETFGCMYAPFGCMSMERLRACMRLLAASMRKLLGACMRLLGASLTAAVSLTDSR